MEQDETERQLLEALAMQEAATMQNYVAVAEGKINNQLATREQIIEALRSVADPEIGINIYDLGLIYDIIQEPNGDVKINMTVTSPMCPVAGILPQQAADSIAQIEGTNVIEVRVVWEPAWSPEKMTDEAKAMLDMF